MKLTKIILALFLLVLIGISAFNILRMRNTKIKYNKELGEYSKMSIKAIREKSNQVKLDIKSIQQEITFISSKSKFNKTNSLKTLEKILNKYNKFIFSKTLSELNYKRYSKGLIRNAINNKMLKFRISFNINLSFGKLLKLISDLSNSKSLILIHRFRIKPNLTENPNNVAVQLELLY